MPSMKEVSSVRHTGRSLLLRLTKLGYRKCWITSVGKTCLFNCQNQLVLQLLPHPTAHVTCSMHPWNEFPHQHLRPHGGLVKHQSWLSPFSLCQFSTKGQRVKVITMEGGRSGNSMSVHPPLCAQEAASKVRDGEDLVPQGS